MSARHEQDVRGARVMSRKATGSSLCEIGRDLTADDAVKMSSSS
jgi:hypothetical protein